ncbi:lysylphosphatidylglycerol synthase transmembrane domain-containing protein [Reichenbachiella ulvae]|uniref:Flippase-like domain-containing protein n=1 Tax=Reichenbachiella ulvae TaxID=2980104 RepID=A0ABT3CWJ5_9BACT|nr:lysylphosphatidylglycerol synthase transmembrane domain-containing protein [Reichenbachiella ulvae]MCV9387904.1 flippase-like domain-containing protein [Reichenbachiella ulvae]
MKVSTVIKFSISLILAGVIFYFVFRSVSFEDFSDKLSLVNYWWVLLSMAISIISHWLRAYRWNLMLEPLGHQLSTGRTFLALMSGYLANLAFPRLGEVTRCGVLKKNDAVPMSVGIGSVITERALDFLILLSLIVLDLIVEMDKILDYFMTSVRWDDWADQRWVIFAIGGLLIVSGIVGILILRYILSKEFKHPTVNKIKLKLAEIVSGLLSIKNVKSPVGYIISTILIWVLYFLMSYVIFFSMEETSILTLGAGLSILAAAGVSMALPVQGGIGAYHAFVSGVLVIYGVGATTGLFLATLLHTSQVILVVLVGGASLLISLFVSKKKETVVPANT